MARTLELDTITEPSNSGTANITLSSNTTTTMPLVDINGGAIDGTTLGAGTPSSVAATTLTTSGAATFGNSADDATTVTGTLTVTRAAALNGNVSIGNASGDTITVVGTTTINAVSGCNTVVGATNGDQTIDIASHDLVNGGLKLGGTLVSASAAELNVMDGGTSATGTTLADADRIVVNDGGTMKQVALSDFETFMESALDTTANITTVGTIATGTWEATDVAVAHGGTGASTLTDGGILLGSGTGAITATAVLADGEMIVGDGTTDPAIESGSTLRTSIGLGSVDNRSEAQIQAATLSAADADDVGLGNVSNIADANQTSVGALATGSIASGFGTISTTNAITTTGVLTAATVDTGNGATEIYDMNQDLRTDDTVAFGTISSTKFGSGVGNILVKKETVSLTSNISVSNTSSYTLIKTFNYTPHSNNYDSTLYVSVNLRYYTYNNVNSSSQVGYQWIFSGPNITDRTNTYTSALGAIFDDNDDITLKHTNHIQALPIALTGSSAGQMTITFNMAPTYLLSYAGFGVDGTSPSGQTFFTIEEVT